MPVSRKKRNKKTNGFGVRAKERHEQAWKDIEAKRFANMKDRDSRYDYMADIFKAVSGLSKLQERKSNKEDLK